MGPECSALSSHTANSRQISRGKTRKGRCVDAGLNKHTPRQMEDFLLPRFVPFPATGPLSRTTPFVSAPTDGLAAFLQPFSDPGGIPAAIQYRMHPNQLSLHTVVDGKRKTFGETPVLGEGGLMNPCVQQKGINIEKQAV